MRNFTSEPIPQPMAANPFVEDLFVDHPDHLPGVARIHHGVFSRIQVAVESLVSPHEAGKAYASPGRLFLLTAPTAGYGKSHLVARLRDQLGTVAPALFLPFDRSRPVSWPVALASVLRQFSSVRRNRRLPVNLLEEFSRYFLSRLVLEALANGLVKTRDCPEASDTVKGEYLSLFTADSGSEILSWLDKRADDLVRQTGAGFALRLGMGRAELAFWTRVFIDLNARDQGSLDRLRGLSNGEARERLLQLLRIATDHRPVMLVADNLDGFFHSETAGMEIAEILNGIRENVPRSVTLLCVNEDVWSSVFATRLPAAWLDRLDGETLPLRPIEAEAAAALVRQRLDRTPLGDTSAERFARQLGDENLWIDSQTRLFPRLVLRQASELWQRESRSFLTLSRDEPAEQDAAEAPLSSLTDKADFFAKLQEEGDAAGRTPRADNHATPSPQTPAQPPLPSSPPPLPRVAAATPPPANPFHAEAPLPSVPEPLREIELSSIDSIINDIRGSGKTVVSESPEERFSKFDAPPAPPVATENPSPPAAPTAPAPAFRDVSLAPEPSQATFSPVHESPGTEPEKETAGRRDPIPSSFFEGLPPLRNREETAEVIRPAGPKASSPAAPSAASSSTVTIASRAQLEQVLAERESELLAGPALTLDLDRLGKFIRKVGGMHAALAQQEERYPSSRTVCLRWNVRGHSVLTGFESPRNVYFWNNLLQQSLASNRQEKIAAFSHASEPFDPTLFASFGFSPAVIRGRIDIIQMSNRELAMIYAADRVLRDHEHGGDGERAAQLITLHLDPLWRRIIQPL